MVFFRKQRSASVKSPSGKRFSLLMASKNDGDEDSQRSTFLAKDDDAAKGNNSLNTDSCSSIASAIDSTPPARKRVRFNEDGNQHYYNDLSVACYHAGEDGLVSNNNSYSSSTDSDDESATMNSAYWYNKTDFGRFKKQQKRTVQQAVALQQNKSLEERQAFFKFVRGLYTTAQVATHSGNNKKKNTRHAETLLNQRQVQYLGSLYKESNDTSSCSESSNSEQQDATTYIHPIELIGLEYQTVAGLSTEGRSLRLAIRRNMKRVQHELQQGWFKADELPSESRAACRKAGTQTAAMFAQLLAKAQYMAGDDDDDETEKNAVADEQ